MRVKTCQDEQGLMCLDVRPRADAQGNDSTAATNHSSNHRKPNQTGISKGASWGVSITDAPRAGGMAFLASQHIHLALARLALGYGEVKMSSGFTEN